MKEKLKDKEDEDDPMEILDQMCSMNSNLEIKQAVNNI